LTYSLTVTRHRNGTITPTSQPHGDTSKTQVIHVPNWASDKRTVSLLFSDYRNLMIRDRSARAPPSAAHVRDLRRMPRI
jgi:hypothetical protein